MSQKFSRVAGLAGAAVVLGMLVTAGIAYATVPTLSQTSVTVGIGQSTSITSENGNDVYMELNSNSVIASVAVNGTQVTITGESLGSATITLCSVGTSADCTNLAVTVQSASVSGISFSQSSLSLTTGTNQSVTISGGNGTYTISSNNNTSVASTGLSGNTLTVAGVAAGSAAIEVCDTANNCGTLSVTVSATSASGLTFSQNNISLAAGTSSQAITISGGNGTYNISSVSNPSVVSPGMSNGAITVYAAAAGSATINVCDSANTCGTLNVTVTGSTASTTGSASTANQAVVFSVTSPTLAVGQSTNITLSGGAPSYFVSANANANVAQASIGGNDTLSLSGLSAGTDSVTICATGGAGCDALPVTVTGATSATTPVTAPAVTTVTTPTVTPTVQPATVVANTALLTEIQTLQTAVTQVLTQVQSIQTQLNQLETQVNAGSGSGISTNASAATNASSGTSYDFTELLTVGSQDAEVTALQERLAALGFYSGPVTGYFGTLTQEAVMKYQTAHGITATGYTGPSTRTALNAGN